MRKIVLKKYEDSFLIARVSEDDTVYEYVVCRDYDGDSWYHGHYFDDLLDATKYFEKDRMNSYEYDYEAIEYIGDIDDEEDFEDIVSDDEKPNNISFTMEDIEEEIEIEDLIEELITLAKERIK